MELLIFKPFTEAERHALPMVEGAVCPHNGRSGLKDHVATWTELTVPEISAWSLARWRPMIVRTGSVGGQGWERWGLAAAKKLDEILAEALGEEAGVWVRPHAADIVSDVPSMVALLKRWHGKVWAVVDPAMLMTAEMMPRAEDHLERMLEAAAHEGVAAVVGPDFGAEAVMVRAWEKHRGMVIALKKPVIVKEESAERARVWLDEKTPG